MRIPFYILTPIQLFCHDITFLIFQKYTQYFKSRLFSSLKYILPFSSSFSNFTEVLIVEICPFRYGNSILCIDIHKDPISQIDLLGDPKYQTGLKKI